MIYTQFFEPGTACWTPGTFVVMTTSLHIAHMDTVVFGDQEFHSIPKCL
jgi:hypothetical protein